MIISNKQNDVYTRGIEETEQFKFTNSPVIFKILSDSLYSDKISSIVRELSCNARDSHVATGKGVVPFDIHLPVYNKKFLFNDENEMYFSVKDYGTGLSEEEIYNLYTVYGESNKRQSNEYIGGFGIGSKSPFAYTDCFTVISRYEGIKTTYSAFVDENGYPSITKIHEEKTDECNGVEVLFSVKESDIDKFINATNRELKFFNPYPNINNKECTPFIKENISDEGEGWFIERYTYGNPSLYFIIGNVLYNVEPEYYTKFWNGTMYISCDVGSVSLAASRENLAYTATTKKIISDKLISIQKEIISRIIEYKKTHSRYDYLLYMNKIPYVYKNFNKELYMGYDIIHDFVKSIELPCKEFNTFLNKHKSDIHIFSYGNLKKLGHEDNKIYIEIANNTKFIYFTKRHYLKDISNYIHNHNDNVKKVVAIRYSDENSISAINEKFYNPSYEKVERVVKEDNDSIIIKNRKIGFRSVSSLNCRNLNSSSMGNYIEMNVEDAIKYMKGNKNIFLYERNEFIGNDDWKREQRDDFTNKFMKIYNIYSNNKVKDEIEVILLSKKSYNVLKKYGVNLTSYKDCYENLKELVITKLNLTEELYHYTSIYSSYVSKIVNYIMKNFTHDEIIQYKNKNIMFDLTDKLLTVISNKEHERILQTFSSIKMIDNSIDNVYNNYILEEPILKLLCSNYVEHNVKPCMVKYLNLN